MRSHRALSLVAALVCLLPQFARAAEPAGTCLLFAGTNISDGSANFFIYSAFSDKRIDLRKGDVLEYEVYLSPANPIAGGGIDFDTDGANLRDSGAVDQNNLRAHADAKLDQHAVGKWYLRQIPLDRLAGQQTRRWNLVFEGDKPGSYAQFVDNVAIVRADGTRIAVYSDGEAPSTKPRTSNEGFSRVALLKPIARDRIVEGANLAKLLESETTRLSLQAKLDEVRAQAEFVLKFADRTSDQHLKLHAEEARKLLEAAQQNDSLDAEMLQSVIHQVHESLGHEHQEMRKYTGHLVGHAHIDFQWLWEWPETIQVCRDTFRQALKFMDEFPGFRFSQSSSALYATTEENHPEVFKGIQKQVEAGNWELVGGRVCEGDEHMISHESHARHFLYGQRYFRERFKGRQCVVGWEPDTFGHTWQMPQILQLGGCKYFYFCRGGRGHPVFWWQAPDGSKVLAFEEPATGGWYNGDVAMNRFDRLLDFAGKTGSRDMLWVYGVGNHGGGPTRENIQMALGFQKVPFLPSVKFSTATDFFQLLEKCDLSKIPTVNGELNTTSSSGFYGTYTSHSDIKRWNRDAEAITESAEAIAAIASRYGFAYPGKEFRRNWEDITWNHHHDTLPGTSIHPSYNKSEQMYRRVIESSGQIAQQALTLMASRVKSDGNGVIVFNPTGFVRDGVVESDLPAGMKSIVAEDDSQTPQRAGEKIVFYARAVPPFGYRHYRFEQRPAQTRAPLIQTSMDSTEIANGQYSVKIDPSRGVVTSIKDRRSGREFIASGASGNRLEIHWEAPHAMSAWVIGRIDKVEQLLGPVELQVTESGDVRTTIAWARKFQSTTLRQWVSLEQQGPPQFGLSTEWKELGSGDKPSPFLKVAFDVACGPQPTFICQIPFGTIERPADNTEVPALKFASLADSSGGAALLNDCKHGYSAQGNTMRLSLIRSSYEPDPRPNDRSQSARWVFMPVAGAPVPSTVAAAAEALNHPLLDAPVTANAAADLPAEMSFISNAHPSVMVSGLKKAEGDDDLVLRFYEIDGASRGAGPKLAFGSSSTRVVNFIEDVVESSNPDAPLRPHEIRTLKIQTRPPG